MAYPSPYLRRTPPSGAVSPEYLRVELSNLQTTLTQVLDMLPQVASVAPAQPQEGMIRFAKAPWRPIAGTTNNGWVIYVTGSWKKIQAPS